MLSCNLTVFAKQLCFLNGVVLGIWSDFLVFVNGAFIQIVFIALVFDENNGRISTFSEQVIDFVVTYFIFWCIIYFEIGSFSKRSV